MNEILINGKINDAKIFFSCGKLAVAVHGFRPIVSVNPPMFKFNENTKDFQLRLVDTYFDLEINEHSIYKCYTDHYIEDLSNSEVMGIGIKNKIIECKLSSVRIFDGQHWHDLPIWEKARQDVDKSLLPEEMER